MLIRTSTDIELYNIGQVQLALLTATVKLFIKRPTAGQELVPKVLKWATEEVDNPDLRDRGFIYWRLLSTDPAAATSIVFSDKPPISTESEAVDRGVLDRLLLHTGTLASLYGKEPQSFIRGAQPKYLKDSQALDQDAKKTYLESLNLPKARVLAPPPLPERSNTSNSNRDVAAPNLPPKLSRGESNYAGPPPPITTNGPNGLAGIVAIGGEEEDEDAALNPTAASPTSPNLTEEDGLDPYASLARLSLDGFGGGGGLRSASEGEGYGYDPMSPVMLSGRSRADDELL